MTSKELSNKLTAIDKLIAIKEFRKNSLLEKLDKETILLEDLSESRKNDDKASSLLRKSAAETRKNSLLVIDEMISNLLKPMYGDDYSFNFHIDEKALEQGIKSGFNITPKITSEIRGEKLTTSIKDSRGGGLAEVVSVWLRLAFLKLTGFNGLIILDEQWASVSFDQKMTELIKFFDAYIKESGIQVLLITHRAEMFGKIADNIIKVERKNGTAQVSNIEYDDLLSHNKMMLNEND